MAGNLLMSVSQSERERAIFRSRRMYQSDQDSNMATAEERGKREGKAEMARKIKLAGHMSIEEIAQLSGFTVAEIEEL